MTAAPAPVRDRGGSCQGRDRRGRDGRPRRPGAGDRGRAARARRRGRVRRRRARRGGAGAGRRLPVPPAEDRRASTAATRCEPCAALLLAARATVAARALLERIGADAVLGGGGYVAGPVGLAAPLAAPAAGLDRGGQPPRRRQPRAGAAGAQGVPRVPARGPRGGALPRQRPCAAGEHRHGRSRGRPRALRDPGATCPACWSSAARSARAGSTTPRSTPSARRRRASCCTPAGGATTPELRARLDELGSPPHYRLEEYIQPFAEALAAADLVVARAGGSVLEVAARRPAVAARALSARDRRPPDRQRPLHGAAGAAVVVPDDELDGPRLAREIGTLLAAPAAHGRDGQRRPRRRPPGCRASGSRTRSSRSCAERARRRSLALARRQAAGAPPSRPTSARCPARGRRWAA